MNNININNLFNNLKTNSSLNCKELNVFNLIETNSFNNNLNDEFIVSKIISNEKNDKKKILDLYETKYKECLFKINSSIDMNLTDVFFNVNDNFFGYKYYSSVECLKYIQEKLRKKNFETFIVNSTNIFISWNNLNISIK